MDSLMGHHMDSYYPEEEEVVVEVAYPSSKTNEI